MVSSTSDLSGPHTLDYSRLLCRVVVEERYQNGAPTAFLYISPPSSSLLKWCVCMRGLDHDASAPPCVKSTAIPLDIQTIRRAVEGAAVCHVSIASRHQPREDERNSKMAGQDGRYGVYTGFGYIAFASRLDALHSCFTLGG